MRESLRELFDELGHARVLAESQAEQHQYGHATVALKRVMSAANKLHTRLSILAEEEADAKFVAEVDRALTRERQSRGFGPIPGDSEIPFPPVEGEASPPRRRGKGKGAMTALGNHAKTPK